MEYKMDTKSNAGRYKPPHLRKRGGKGNDSFDGRNSDSESSRYDLSSSDSDMSDSDGYAKTGDRFRSSKARLAAILCIQVCCYIICSNSQLHFPFLFSYICLDQLLFS